VDQRQVGIQEAVSVDAGDRRAMQFREIVDGVFQLPRAHILGGRVDQVAGQRLAGGDPFQPGGVEMGRRAQAGFRRGLGPVARKDVEREQVAERDFGAQGPLGPGLHGIVGFGQLRDRAPMAKRVRARSDSSPMPIRTMAGRPSAPGMAQDCPRFPAKP
jgi:hypothetical protein